MVEERVQSFLDKVEHFLTRETHIWRYQNADIPYDLAITQINTLCGAYLNYCVEFYYNGDDILVVNNCHRCGYDCNLDKLDIVLKEFKKKWRKGL